MPNDPGTRGPLILIDGGKLRSLRKEKNLSQGEFASICGVSQAYISMLEKNSIPGCSLNTAEKLADTLECPVEALQSEIKEIKGKLSSSDINQIVERIGQVPILYRGEVIRLVLQQIDSYRRVIDLVNRGEA